MIQNPVPSPPSIASKSKERHSRYIKLQLVTHLVTTREEIGEAQVLSTPGSPFLSSGIFSKVRFSETERRETVTLVRLPQLNNPGSARIGNHLHCPVVTIPKEKGRETT